MYPTTFREGSLYGCWWDDCDGLLGYRRPQTTHTKVFFEQSQIIICRLSLKVDAFCSNPCLCFSNRLRTWPNIVNIFSILMPVWFIAFLVAKVLSLTKICLQQHCDKRFLGGLTSQDIAFLA